MRRSFKFQISTVLLLLELCIGRRVAAVEGGYPISVSSEYMHDKWQGCYSITKLRLNSATMGCGAEAWIPAYSHGTGNYVDWV